MKTPYLFLVQRASAVVMAPLVLIHLGVILYTARGGVSAAEILSRTQGSFGWGLFYGLFVVAAALHVSVGLRTVIEEWTVIKGRRATIVAMVFALSVLVLGLRAVYAVVAS